MKKNKANKKIWNTARGFTLIEALVGAAILVACAAALFSAYALFLRGEFLNINKIQANLLAEEGIEAVRLMRDQSFSQNIAPIAAGSPRYLNWDSSASAWNASASDIFIDGIFERKIVFDSVSRDSAGDITASGGTIDPNARKVTLSVSWRAQTGTTTVSLAAYMTNLFAN